jgi:hypothetical protein
MGNAKASAEYLPSATLASGNATPAAGTSDSAWGAGVDSSAGGATSSSATAVEGSSPPRTDLLISCRSTQIGCQLSSTATPRTTQEGSVLTSLTGLSSRSGLQGCWQYLPVQPRWAPPLAPLRLLPLLQQQ